jgi:hypothetical protein
VRLSATEIAGQYGSLSRADKDQEIVKLQVTGLSLPPKDRAKVDILRVLPPWLRYMLAEENFHRLLDDSKMSGIKDQKAFNHFESESDRCKVMIALHERKMLEFIDLGDGSVLMWGENGMFGLIKPDGSIRLLCDARRGNWPFISMSALQDLYEEWVNGRPGYPKKILNLVNPAWQAASALPGALAVAKSDISDYFHVLVLPRWMRKHQIFGVFRACDVGLVGTHLVIARGITQIMGGTLAVVLAQAAHEFCLLPSWGLVKTFRRIEYVSTARKDAVAKLTPDADDMVLASAVPSQLLEEVLAPMVIGFSVTALASALQSSELPLHVSALYVEEADAQDPPGHCVTLRGLDRRRGDLRQQKLIYDSTEDDVPVTQLLTWSLYIDDQLIEALKAVGLSVQNTFSLLNFRLVVSVAYYTVFRFFLKPPKLCYAMVSTATSGKSLGYRVDMASLYTRHHVDFDDLARLASLTREVVRRVRAAARCGHTLMVSLDLLQHILGHWVWGMLVRRCLLSIFSLIFRLIAHNHDYYILSRGVLRELEMAADLFMFMVGKARDMCSTVSAFDASSTAFGIAVRENCPPMVLAELASHVERIGKKGCAKFSTEEDGTVSAARTEASANVAAALQTGLFLKCDWSSRLNKWKAVTSHAFIKKPEFIMLAEKFVGSMAIEWFAKRPSLAHGKLHLHIGDNQPSLGATAKGRSSCSRVNMYCRRDCAILLLCDMDIFPLWVRSSSMPADGPSRWPNRRPK